MSSAVFRFAPSPNGRLHLGHAYSALLNAGLARAQAGRFLLRIEDIDIIRCKPELEQAIYDDLGWLGLKWEEPVRRQSAHFADYRAAFARLQKLGIVYPCFCSRKEIQGQALSGRDPDGAPLYPGTCRDLSPADKDARFAEAHSWRLDMERALDLVGEDLTYRAFAFDQKTMTTSEERQVSCEPRRWGDPVIIRKETPTSYHLSVVVDDALQGVSHVVRGQDLEAATDLHVLLQKLLDLPTPSYHHHPLIRDGEGEKLSKSLVSTSLADLRASGATAEDIRHRLGFS